MMIASFSFFDYNYPIREIKGLPIHADMESDAKKAKESLYDL